MEASEVALNIETVEQSGPVQKSCCFCIPLRLGIIILALIKMALSLGLLIILFEFLYLPNILFGYLIIFFNIVPWMAFTLDVVDVVIALVVIIGVCLKNGRIMKMYYMYSICVFGSLTFMCCVIVFITSVNIITLMIFMSLDFFVFMFQMYLNHLLKCEVLKMGGSEQIQL